MALCEWREDWPPRNYEVQNNVMSWFPNIKFDTFNCSHPYVGPEEYMCVTYVRHKDRASIIIEFNELKTFNEHQYIDIHDRASFELCRFEII